MEKSREKEQSMATKLALLLTAVCLFVVGLYATAIGTVDQVWEHALGMCMVLSSILLVDEIDDKRQFVKDLLKLFK